eukprot:5724796-Pleurochrysis_carterae.AAC.1
MWARTFCLRAHDVADRRPALRFSGERRRAGADRALGGATSGRAGQRRAGTGDFGPACSGRDGTVRFTGSRAAAIYRPANGGVDVELFTSALGGSVRVPAEQVIFDNVGALPGVWTLGQRRGAYTSTLRWQGVLAVLSPHGDEPLASV